MQWSRQTDKCPQMDDETKTNINKKVSILLILALEVFINTAIVACEVK